MSHGLCRTRNDLSPWGIPSTYLGGITGSYCIFTFPPKVPSRLATPESREPRTLRLPPSSGPCNANDRSTDPSFAGPVLWRLVLLRRSRLPRRIGSEFGFYSRYRSLLPSAVLRICRKRKLRSIFPQCQPWP